MPPLAKGLTNAINVVINVIIVRPSEDTFLCSGSDWFIRSGINQSESVDVTINAPRVWTNQSPSYEMSPPIDHKWSRLWIRCLEWASIAKLAAQGGVGQSKVQTIRFFFSFNGCILFLVTPADLWRRVMNRM